MTIHAALGIESPQAAALPEFILEVALQDPDKLSAFIDETLIQQEKEREQEQNNGGGGLFSLQDDFNFLSETAKKKTDLLDDFLDDYSSGSIDDVREGDIDGRLTEEEMELECVNMKEKYQVLIGVSWGTLPYDLQKSWSKYGCDLFFAADR